MHALKGVAIDRLQTSYGAIDFTSNDYSQNNAFLSICVILETIE